MSLLPDGAAAARGGGGGGGGFLTSPAYSIATNTSSASTITPSRLPRQRTHPLKVGSMKETALINHVDAQIRKINRRHAKKFSRNIDEHTDTDTDDAAAAAAVVGRESSEEEGYENFREVVRDIERVIDVVWVSGTPSLQIPYLISVAGLINTYLPDFPFSPKSTFRLLRKLDLVFVSLLTGEDADSGVPLSGFETRRNVVSMTEKVRIKNIAEASRIAVIEARERDQFDEEEGEDEDEDEDEDEEEEEENEMDIDREFDESRDFGVDMEVARIYERTIQYLGDELGKEAELVV